MAESDESRFPMYVAIWKGQNAHDPDLYLLNDLSRPLFGGGLYSRKYGTCIIAKNRMSYAVMSAHTHVLNKHFVFIKLILTFALCTHRETAKNMLCVDIAGQFQLAHSHPSTYACLMHMQHMQVRVA